MLKMSYSLTVNNTNVVGSNNNTYQYNFTKGNFTIPENAENMITSIHIPYSWFNISATYNNNSLKIYIPTASTTYTSFTISIPDGFYTTTSLNSYLQQVCITNGLYLIDGSGNCIYYIVLAYNTTYYANQIFAFTVPTSLPVGYTAPSNWIGYPVVSRTPYISILSTSKFGTFLGFTTGDYPWTGQTSNYSINSNITPVGSTVNSIIVRCSLVNNNITSPTDILDSFTIGGATFGSYINFNNNIEKWIKLTPGSHNNFTITLVDQNFNTIYILDNNILISLIIRINKK